MAHVCTLTCTFCRHFYQKSRALRVVVKRVVNDSLPIVFIGQTLSYSFQTFNLRFIPVVVPINQESIVWPNNKLHLNLQQTIFV